MFTKSIHVSDIPVYSDHAIICTFTFLADTCDLLYMYMYITNTMEASTGISSMHADLCLRYQNKLACFNSGTIIIMVISITISLHVHPFITRL